MKLIKIIINGYYNLALVNLKEICMGNNCQENLQRIFFVREKKQFFNILSFIILMITWLKYLSNGNKIIIFNSKNTDFSFYHLFYSIQKNVLWNEQEMVKICLTRKDTKNTLSSIL